MKRVKRLLKAGVVSALACMVKADSAILTDQSKELIARCLPSVLGAGGAGLRWVPGLAPCLRGGAYGGRMKRGWRKGLSTKPFLTYFIKMLVLASKLAYGAVLQVCVANF